MKRVLAMILAVSMALSMGMSTMASVPSSDSDSDSEGLQDSGTYSIELSETDTYTFTGATVGYSAQTPLNVTVTNSGTAATGALTVALSGDDASSFALDSESIDSIAVEDEDTFTVTPNTGLSAGTYTATVTVSNQENNISETFDVSFTVSAAPTYGVTLSKTGTHTFTGATVGYSAQTPLTVTVTNTGTAATGALTVALSGDDAGSFTASKTSINSIAASATDTFTVVPITGLAAGTYTATVTVSGSNNISGTFDVTFTVSSSGSGGSGASGGSGGGSGSGGGLINASQSTATITTGTVGTTANTAPVTATAATKAVSSAIAAAASGQQAQVALKNVTSISPQIAAQIAAAVQKAGKTSVVIADTVVNGVVQARIYLDPVAVSKLSTPIDLRVDCSKKATEKTSQTFGKYFSNQTAVISLGQQGAFGMAVTMAVKVDLSKLNKDTLQISAYNKATNTYQAIANANISVDKNGYLRFTTPVGGDIIVTDKPLSRK